MRYPVTLNRAELRAALVTLNRATPGIRAGELAAVIDATPAGPEGPTFVTITATDGDRTATVELPSADFPAGAVAFRARFRAGQLAVALKGKGPRTVTVGADTETDDAAEGPDGIRTARGIVASIDGMTVAVPDADGPDADPDGPAYGATSAAGVSWAELATVAAVTSTDRARPILTAVSLRPAGPGMMEAAGTDSYRLAARTVPGPDLAAPVLIPADVITLAARTEDAGRLYVSPDRYGVTAGPLSIVGRWTVGDFPNYHQLAPATADLVTWTVSRAELATVAATVAARNGKNPGPLVIDAGPEGITVATRDGNVTATLGGHRPSVPVRFGVDPGFLGDALRDPEGAELATFRTPESPLRPFYVDTRDGGDGIAAPGRTLVMPVRVA